MPVHVRPDRHAQGYTAGQFQHGDAGRVPGAAPGPGGAEGRRPLRAPTEGSVIATVGDVGYRHIAAHGAEYSISVGQALLGYVVYVVDENDQALPAGVPGQVAVAGPAVAPGYLHLPDLTDAKFEPDTISPNVSGKERRGGGAGSG